MPSENDITPQIDEPLPKENSTFSKPTTPLNTVFLVLVALVFTSSVVLAIFRLSSRLTPQAPLDNETVTLPEKEKEELPTEVDETEDWKIYTDKEFEYSFKYPNSAILEELGSGYQIEGKTTHIVRINKQIEIYIAKGDLENCRGDCPIIESRGDVSGIGVQGLKARQLDGWVGTIGGNICQNYRSIVINHNGLSYILDLWELPVDSEEPMIREPGGLKVEDIAFFNQILSTFRFD